MREMRGVGGGMGRERGLSFLQFDRCSSSQIKRGLKMDVFFCRLADSNDHKSEPIQLPRVLKRIG